jgi:hypothetical protein
MTDKHNDEIDLGLIFRKIKEGYNSMLVAGYNAVQFAKKNWIILLILIVGGAVAGHFWQENHKAGKMATLIIQNNFGSSSYVYEAVSLFNKKQKQGDAKFLKQYGFDAEDMTITEVEIEPIVNIIELLKKSEENDRNLEQYLAQSDFEDDILLSEVFYPEYKYHKLYISTTSEGSVKTIEKFLAYLNNNDLFLKAKDIVIEETKERIIKNDSSIANIDAVFYETSAKYGENKFNPSQVYFKSLTNNNLHLLLETKNALIAENESLKIELLKYDNVVSVINKPALHYTFSLLDNKRVLFPLVLVFLFGFFAVLRRLYKKAERFAKAQANS